VVVAVVVVVVVVMVVVVVAGWFVAFTMLAHASLGALRSAPCSTIDRPSML
jgi:hypothetical protein